jgi:hypothetical protein
LQAALFQEQDGDVPTAQEYALRIVVDTNGERPDPSSAGRTKRRQSGSSPICPSPAFTRRAANTMRMALAELYGTSKRLTQGRR